MQYFDETQLNVFKQLCLDSRTSTKEIAEKVGVSEVTARKCIRQLENEWGVKYVVELNQARTVYPTRYIIAAKLRHRPDKGTLLKILESSPVPQFAAFCEGEFNLFMYAAALSPVDYMQWQFRFRSTFEDELVFWRPSTVILERQGVFPFRNDLLKSLDLPKNEVDLLCALNSNARSPLTDIAKSTGLELSTVQYHFKRLEKSGVVERFTAVMTRPPQTLVQSANFLSYTYTKKHQEQSEAVRKLLADADPGLLNLHLSVIESNGAYDGFYLLSSNGINEGYTHIRTIDNLFDGSLTTQTAIFSEIIFGLPPFRNIDPSLSYVDTDWMARKSGNNARS